MFLKRSKKPQNNESNDESETPKERDIWKKNNNNKLLMN